MLINKKNEKKEIKKFSITFGIILGILGTVLFFRGREFYFYFLFLSLFFLIVGFFAPTLTKPIYKFFMILATFMNKIVTVILLSIMFYLVITPIGILAKLFGKDFLDLKFDKKADSYWIQRKEVNIEKSDYERQF
jgi:hypothetical protein